MENTVSNKKSINLVYILTLSLLLMCFNVFADAIIAQYSMSYYSQYMADKIVSNIKNNNVTRVDLTYTGGWAYLANEIKQTIGQNSNVTVDMINIGQNTSSTINAVVISIFGTIKNQQSQLKNSGSFYDYTTSSDGFYSK